MRGPSKSQTLILFLNREKECNNQERNIELSPKRHFIITLRVYIYIYIEYKASINTWLLGEEFALQIKINKGIEMKLSPMLVLYID